MSLSHRVTTSPCHCISQSFALPPAIKPVSHLPCHLPPKQSVICLAPYHHVTVSPHHRATVPPCHCVTASLRHRISQSFALPPATKPVSHLPCPLPPNQSVICLAPYHCVNASPHHRITALVSHLPCPLPPSQSVICLAPCHQTSQSFALPPTSASLHHHVTVSPHHCITTSPHHRITASLHHRITALVSHLSCPLPPSQSVICLAPCHQTSQSFALPPTTASPCHHITAPPHHHVTASLH